MDENEFKPMSDADVLPPVGAASGVDTSSGGAGTVAGSGDIYPKPAETTGFAMPANAAEARQRVVDGAGRLSQQASDKALMFAGQGKERASGALDQLSQMLTDAGQQVDQKLGTQYGDVARSVAGSVQEFAGQLRGKDVNDLFDETRVLVGRNPGAAIGVAAALGFVAARLVSAGLDQRGA